MNQLQANSLSLYASELCQAIARVARCRRPVKRSDLACATRRRQGYTLVELMIVLAILVMVMSLAVPSFRRLARRSDVQDSARQLRAELMRARLQAIESGRPQFFQYQAGTGAYQVVPAADANLTAADSTEPDQLDGVASLSVESSAESTTLHEGVVFVDPSLERGETFATNDAANEWSDPVIFYPNGRSHNAAFRVANDAYQVGVTLRGLTGAIRLAPLQPVAQAEGEPLPDVSVGF